MPGGEKKQLDERGFASIVIALIMITVLALLTTGFVQVALREQQDSLSDQLNSQAYYAAESGINDFDGLVQSAVKGSTNPSEPTLSTLPINTCLHESYLQPNLGGTGSGVSYSCLMLVSFDTTGQTATVDVTGQARNVLKRLQASISWDTTGSVKVTSMTNLPPVL